METRVHGTLVDVLGLGVLLLGPSGIGKSECARELVTRGHRRGADDVVALRRDRRGRLIGRAPAITRHHLELRGIGIVSIRDLYGPEAVRDESPVDLACRLENGRNEADYERVGLEPPTEKLAGAELPSLLLPVRPAASMATLVEVAVRDRQMRSRGVNAARRFDARVRGEHAPS